MILNAYDYVKDLIQKGRHSILDNEIDKHPHGRVIVEILKADYSAKYNPSEDMRCCGSWSFDNPTLEKKKYKVLNYICKETNYKPSSSSWRIEDNENFSYGHFAKEIARMETGGHGSQELEYLIYLQLQSKQGYIGKRIWFVSEEYTY